MRGGFCEEPGQADALALAGEDVVKRQHGDGGGGRAHEAIAQCVAHLAGDGVLLENTENLRCDSRAMRDCHMKSNTAVC